MCWRLNHLAHRAYLHEPTSIHDADSVGDGCNHPNVMANEYCREAQAVRLATQQIQNLSLDRHVQSGGGLIGNKQLWPARDRNSNHYALTHSARQLMWVTSHRFGGVRQADFAEQVDRSLPRLSLRIPQMITEPLGQLLANRQNRVEGGKRMLKYHSYCTSAEPAHLSVRCGGNLVIVETDRTADNLPAREMDQEGNRQRESALTATRLAYDAQRL